MEIVSLFSEAQKELLFANFKDNWRKNHVPVAYLEIRKLGYSFLVTELDDDNKNYAFGLCDYDADVSIDLIDLKELAKKAESVGDKLICRDREFSRDYNLAVYAKAATKIGALFFEDDGKDYKKIYQGYNKGKNCDSSLSILKLKQRLVW